MCISRACVCFWRGRRARSCSQGVATAQQEFLVEIQFRDRLRALEQRERASWQAIRRGDEDLTQARIQLPSAYEAYVRPTLEQIEQERLAQERQASSSLVRRRLRGKQHPPHAYLVIAPVTPEAWQ